MAGMWRVQASRPHGLRCIPLPQRNRISRVLRVRSISGSTEPADSPGEPVEFQYAPPQYPAQYYQTVPPPAPVPVAPPASGTPFWVWVLVGIAVHWIYTKVQEFRKNPMAAIAGMMGAAKPGGGMGGPAAGGDMAQMMEMMQRMQQQQQQASPGAGPGGYSYGGMPSSTTINTTASDVVQPAPTPESPSRPGAKFEANKKGFSSGGTSTPTSSQPETPTPPPPSFFSDTQAAATTSFFQDTSNNASQAAGSAPAPEQSIDMVDNMLLMVADNPELRKQLGVHLPESMNNESTWKWIKENPEMRRQMAQQISPGLAAQFGDMSMFNQAGNSNNEDLMKQMKSMGVDPNEMMGKVMADPEVMQIMTKPHVAQALMEMQSNPASAMNHMKDPDIFKLMQKMMEMNPALKGGMPPGA